MIGFEDSLCKGCTKEFPSECEGCEHKDKPMAFKVIERIKSWSPTTLNLYEECPRRAYYKIIKKLPDPAGPAGQRGIELHAWCDKYVKGEVEWDAVPTDLHKTKAYLDYYRSRHAAGFALSEQKLAFDEEWNKVDWRSDKAWLRTVIDIVEFLDGDCLDVEVADWKSGQLKKDDLGYAKQTNLYCVCAMSAGWAQRQAKSKLIFLDHNVEVPSKDSNEGLSGLVTLDNLRRNQRWWENRAERMMEDTEFCMNPSWQCKRCPYSGRYNGGPCEF